MKQTITILLLLCLSAQTFAQDIIGKWWDEERRGQTEIYKSTTGKLYGKIVWLKVPNDPKTSKPQLDIHNKDKSKRDRPNMGMIVLLGLVETSKGVFEGQVYNPKDGNTYSGTITMLPDGKLKLRGYMGISLLGKTEIWERVQ
jgi:uncharacterized protein (DUF2147 family)